MRLVSLIKQSDLKLMEELSLHSILSKCLRCMKVGRTPLRGIPFSVHAGIFLYCKILRRVGALKDR